MSPDTAPGRTGVFISHAHEDQELADALREHLETVLGLDRASITCTSDPNYGLARGSELDDQIRSRLNSAKALFLIATQHSKGKEWVQYECAYADQANARGEMQFYVLTPSASQLTSVPAPYQQRVAVTLSRAGDLHEFTRQLRKTLLTTADEMPPICFSTLLKLHARGDDAERRELAEISQELDAKGRQLATQRDRFRHQRLWSWVVTAGLAAAFIVNILAQGREKATLIAAHRVEVDRLTTTKSDAELEAEERRDQELRSLPFSGFVQDGSDNFVRCRRVTATVPPRVRGEKPRVVSADCRDGRFTFDPQELGIDPRQIITLTVDVQNTSRDITIARSALPVALSLSGVIR
jgi:hypothetical protein